MHQRGAAPFFSPCHRPRFASRRFASPTLALSPTHRQRACHLRGASGSTLRAIARRPAAPLRRTTAHGHEHLRLHHGRTRRAPLLSVVSAFCTTQCRSASAQRSLPWLGPDRLHPCHFSRSTAEPLWSTHLTHPWCLHKPTNPSLQERKRLHCKGLQDAPQLFRPRTTFQSATPSGHNPNTIAAQMTGP